MSILYSIIADVLHIAGILLICKNYLRLREKAEDNYRYAKVLLISAFASLMIHETGNRIFALFVYLACLIIVFKICYIENNKKIAICAIWVSIIVEFIELIAMLLLDTIGEVVDFSNDSLENILGALFSLGVIGVASRLLNKITDEGIRNISTRYLVFFTGNLFVNFYILALMANVTLEEEAYSNKFAYIIICILVTLGLFIEMISVILLLVSRNMYKEKELIIKQYLEKQAAYYEYLKEREIETKKFRHDIRSHLYFLNTLRKEGKNQEFEDYFQDIIGKVDDLGNSICVGNDIVDAVLNQSYADTERKHIKMKVTGHFPSKCNISAYNLCTIFFNLLNNAIEAADKTEKREIWVICRYAKDVIIVEIGNYYYNDKLDKNRLQTTKGEKEYHGWGMKNVEDSIRDCKGLMDIEIADDKFIVSITLKNEKEDNAG